MFRGRLRYGKLFLFLGSLLALYRVVRFHRLEETRRIDRHVYEAGKQNARARREKQRATRIRQQLQNQQQQQQLYQRPITQVQRLDRSVQQDRRNRLPSRNRDRINHPRQTGNRRVVPMLDNHFVRSGNQTFWVTDDGKLRDVNHKPPQKGTGYAPGGGQVPEDPNRLYPDPRTWENLDNHTCLHQSDEPVFEWQKRAPYAILLGAMKAGTQALTTYLWQHPNVSVGGLEKHFFNAPDFLTSAQGISQALNQKAYAMRFRKSHADLFLDVQRNQPNPHKYAFDSTPYYLLASDRMPASILCVAPWAKLIAILRDPVERAASHYRYLNAARERNAKPMVDWETWVQHDLDLLRQAGVVQDWNVVDFDSYAGSEEELTAWKKYIRSPNSQQLLGRGLYAIQISHYLQALKDAGRPQSDLHVILSEDLRTKTQQVFDDLLKFLALPPYTLHDTSEKHPTPDKGQKMPDQVRQQLEIFFEPYNQRLYKLLGWSKVWPATD